MDTIRNYVDMMFKDLPKTKEVVDMKLNILDHMEDKYSEMIRDGKTENEAIGTVISQFGNIDEVKEELGIASNNNEQASIPEPSIPYMDDETIMNYLRFKSSFGFSIAFGVALCITSVIWPTFNALGDIGTVMMFFMIACAVAIFIIMGIKNAEYADFEKQAFQITNTLKEKISQTYQSFKTTFSFSIAIGVGFCILAPVIYMIVENSLSLDISNFFSRRKFSNTVDGFASASLFICVAIGVFLMISSGIKKSAYDFVLQNKKTLANRKKEEDEEHLYGIIMPLAAIIYLMMGFCFGWWHPGWLIFPIAALLVPAFRMIKGEK